jgi:cytochrome c biogenesis protein
VNHPASHGENHTSPAFDDGGSRVKLQAIHSDGAAVKPFEIEGTVGGSSEVSKRRQADAEYTGRA